MKYDIEMALRIIFLATVRRKGFELITASAETKSADGNHTALTSTTVEGSNHQRRRKITKVFGSGNRVVGSLISNI